MKAIKTVAILLASGSAFALAPIASAQDAPPQDTESAGTAEDPAAAEAEFVVTGSRVIKNGNNSPSPVTVIGTGDFWRRSQARTSPTRSTCYRCSPVRAARAAIRR